MCWMWEGFSEVGPHFTSENPFSVMCKKLLPLSSQSSHGEMWTSLCIRRTCNLRTHRVETTIATRPHDLLDTSLYRSKMYKCVECMYTFVGSNCFTYQGMHTRGKWVILWNVENPLLWKLLMLKVMFLI